MVDCSLDNISNHDWNSYRLVLDCMDSNQLGWHDHHIEQVHFDQLYSEGNRRSRRWNDSLEKMKVVRTYLVFNGQRMRIFHDIAHHYFIVGIRTDTLWKTWFGRSDTEWKRTFFPIEQIYFQEMPKWILLFQFRINPLFTTCFDKITTKITAPEKRFTVLVGHIIPTWFQKPKKTFIRSHFQIVDLTHCLPIMPKLNWI